MTVTIPQPTLALQYKRVKQPVVVRASKLSNVPPARRRAEDDKSGTAAVTGVTDPTTPVMMNATLPDVDTVIKGEKTKIVFKYVDSEKIQILAMPLESAYLEANGKVTPIVYDMVLDFKANVVLVNGAKVFELQGVTSTQKVFTGTIPEVFSNVNVNRVYKKPKKGIVFPAVMKVLSFLSQLAYDVLIISLASFVVPIAKQYAGYVLMTHLPGVLFTNLASSIGFEALKNGFTGAAANAKVDQTMTTVASTFGTTPSDLMSKGVEFVTYIPTKGVEMISGVYAAVFN